MIYVSAPLSVRLCNDLEGAKKSEWMKVLGEDLKRSYKSLQDPTDQLYVGITIFIPNKSPVIPSIDPILAVLKSTVKIQQHQISHLNVKKEFDKKNPHIEIEIEKLEI